MNQEIFKEWFEKNFFSQVREHLKSQNLPQKAVLLIDNAPSHPVDLKSEDGNIFVKFLTPNITAFIQPMDQRVIASMKKNYRKSLLEKRIEEGHDLKSFWKDYTILDSIYDINTAWRLVKQTTLVKSWRKILPSVENTLIGEEEKEVSAFDLANFSKSLTRGENVDEENINEWINCDANDQGFERLSDEQIVSEALGTVSESEGEEEENDEVNKVKQVSHEAALKHVDGIIKFLEEQDDTILCDKMLLKKLQSQVKKKSFQTKKQQLVIYFFAHK
uniref:Jerky-like n=1 Tax=Sipha flava TaxID=143950 RepID=A0A2S2QZ92_9HEMI